ALSLSANGSVLAVGATGEDSNSTDQSNNSAPDAGAAYVFTRSGAVWTQQSFIKAGNVEQGDLFGSSVALNTAGTLLAVGAAAEDSGAGAVYVFTNAGPLWTQSAYIKAPNAEPFDKFGA